MSKPKAPPPKPKRVQDRFGRENAADQKERTGQQLRRLVRLSLDKLEAALLADRIPPGQITVTAAILIDKHMLWEGQAGQTITVRHEVDQRQIRRMFAELASPAPIDVPMLPAPAPVESAQPVECQVKPPSEYNTYCAKVGASL